jgi:hypothetical protein
VIAVIVAGARYERHLSEVEVYLPSLGPTSTVQPVSMAAEKRKQPGTPDGLYLLSANPLAATHLKHPYRLRSISAGQSSIASEHRVAKHQLRP